MKSGSSSRSRSLAVAWRLQLGLPGIVGLACLALAAYLAAVYAPALQAEQDELRARQQQARERPATASRRTTPTSAALHRVDSLPAGNQRGADLARLIEISRRTGVELTRGDYTTNKPSAADDADASAADAVSQWHLQLPVRGNYTQVRRFIAEMLNTMPHAALDGLQVERPDTRQTTLETTLRITLFYRATGS